MNKFVIQLCLFALIMSMFSCQTSTNNFNESDYQKSIQEWKAIRLENLKSENGWLNLVGLHWLKDGENPFGSNEANNIIFPKNAPEFIGSISLYNSALSVRINDDIDVFINDTLSKEHEVFTDMDKNTTYFRMGSFRWHVIKRGNKYGIRLRDLENPLLNLITEIPSYPVDSRWRIKAKFEKFDSPKEIAIPNVLGETELEECYGILKFNIDGEEYRLMPLGDGINENLFLIFADETSAIETYGAGRFLSVEKPNDQGETYIDFNKATNPPCAFTEFATCPLPPRDNVLEVKITAGEKTGEHIGHH